MSDNTQPTRCEAREEPLDVVANHGGNQVLVMATGCPHPDAAGTFPNRTVGGLTRSAALSDALKGNMLWDNPAPFYGIESGVRAPI